SEDRNKLIWALMTEMEKPVNSKVLFGQKAKGENTSGDTKVAVHKRIGEAIMPEYYALEPGTVGERCKARIEWLQTKYKAQAKRLQQTGGGIGMETFRGEDGNEYMAFYIPSTGPDCTTTPEAVNIWAQIEQEFPFFPRLHQIFATRPNVTPIAITTGVGPRGPSTLYVQPPDESFTPAQVAQINTLQDALNLAAAYPNRFDNDNEPIWSGSTNLQDGRDRDGPAADDPVDLDDDVVLVNPPQVPVTPAPHRSNAGKKENIVPTPQTQTRGPKALKHEASIERARAAIKKLPVKQTPLDRLLVLQE
ncbi:hypothetical protein C8R44DRAFT_653212, partial [Mycena epipterygia]